MLQLRDYQLEAVDRVHEAEARGIRRPLIVHPTGAGKTVTFSEMIRQWYEPTCVLVHRDELAQQTLEKLEWIAPDLDRGLVKAQHNDVHAQVVVASVQTLARESRRLQLPHFSKLVVDEAHHASAPSWHKVLTALGAFDPRGPLTVGFTATPQREGSRLGVWEEVVAYRSIRQMVMDGYLSPVSSQVVNTKADFTQVRTSSGDLLASLVGEEMERANAVADIARAYKKYASGRKGLAFLPTVDTAFALVSALHQQGITAEAVWGNMDPLERKAVLKRLRSGETQVVCNCGVLTEGFDEPSVSCIVIGRPTKSHTLYVQMVGRGLRRAPGKKDCLILDVVGASQRHDLVALVDLGVDYMSDWQMSGKTGTGERPEWFQPGEANIGGARRTTIVDPFAASRLRWLPVERGWCLGADDGAIIMAPRPDDDELWTLARYRRGKIEMINQSVPQDWAQGIGEDHAKAFGKVNRRDAHWLRLPATEAQLGRLVREGLPEDKLSKIKNRGQAADLLTRITARRGYRKLVAA